MITLKNWYQQQPEVVYFVQTDYQGDEFMKKLVRSKMSKEAWDKIVDRYSDREIYKVITENHSGELHRWVYFKEGEQMCTNIDTVISLIVVYVIGFLCIALVGYRVGCWIGEKTAYKRFTKVCNVCRNKDK